MTKTDACTHRRFFQQNDGSPRVMCSWESSQNLLNDKHVL